MVNDKRQKEEKDGRRTKLVIKWSKLIKYWIKIIIISNKCLYETIGLNAIFHPQRPQPQSLQLCTRVWIQTHAIDIRKTIREQQCGRNESKQTVIAEEQKREKTDRPSSNQILLHISVFSFIFFSCSWIRITSGEQQRA